MRNEKGFIFPLMLVLSLIIASLLITSATQLKNQAQSYEYRRIFQKLTLLEKECVSQLLKQIDDFDIKLENGNSTLTLRDGTLIPITYSNKEATLEFSYKISYNGHSGKGALIYYKQEQTYTLK